MRVHPDLLGSKPKWQLPAVLGLLASTIFVSGLLSDGSNRAIATQSNRISNLEVVVVRSNLIAGQLIASSDLGLEVRSIETVPEGAFTKLDDVVGKHVGVDLRAGSLIAKLSLAADVPSVPVEPPPVAKILPPAHPVVEAPPQVAPVIAPPKHEAVPPKHEAPVAKHRRVEIPVLHGDVPLEHVTETVPPPAVKPIGDIPAQPQPAKILPPAPVEKPPAVSPPPAVKPIVDPAVEPAKVVPPPVVEPAKIVPPPVVEPAVEPAKIVPSAAVPPQPNTRKAIRRKFRSYAWVAGGPVTYGVNKSGEIEVIDRNGTASPLDDYDEEE